MRSIDGGRKQGLSLDLVKGFSSQLCRGIVHMHTKLDLIHRDLKPQNLLIAGQRTLKIADFGLARQHSLNEFSPHCFTPEVVTFSYRAPELLLGSAVYNVTLDLWSIGCIIVEMALGSPIFEGTSELDTIFHIFRLLGTPTEATLPGVASFPYLKGEFNPKFPMWPQKPWNESYPLISNLLGPHGIELVASFLVYDPRNRISARMAVQHEFFQGFHGAEPSVQRQLSRKHTPDQRRRDSRLAADSADTPENPNTNEAHVEDSLQSQPLKSLSRAAQTDSLTACSSYISEAAAAVGDAACDKKRSLTAVMCDSEGHSSDESIHQIFTPPKCRRVADRQSVAPIK